MIKKLLHVILFAVLSFQLVMCTGCISMATIQKPEYAPLLQNKPLSDETLQSIKSTSPKDAVFADLLQAFSLLRSDPIEKPETRTRSLSLLAESVSAFEDMTGPANFSKAFSIDENTDFRGRPHERVFASLTAGILHMAEGRCDLALPYFRNAEFLDARFQKMPFGTDVPLTYALIYRCLRTTKSDDAELTRAIDGIYRSVRFLTWQEPLIEALTELNKADLRPYAVSNRLAYMLYEISLYHSLLSASSHNINDIIGDASKNVSLFLSALDGNFENEYKARMKPLVSELAQVYRLNKADGIEYLEDLAIKQVSLASETIAKRMKEIASGLTPFTDKIKQATEQAQSLSSKIIHAASAPQMVLNFSGNGPSIVREGSYNEITRVQPSPDGTIAPIIREKSITTTLSCGFHRTENGGFSLVLCDARTNQIAHNSSVQRDFAELFSLSRKATTAVGRRFDTILKGRAQFRAATENIAVVSAWSAFFLFHMGSEIIKSCQRKNGSEACYATGYGLWAIAGVTVVFSGTVWLVGRTSNPAADSRYIHSMYESVWMAL